MRRTPIWFITLRGNDAVGGSGRRRRVVIGGVLAVGRRLLEGGLLLLLLSELVLDVRRSIRDRDVGEVVPTTRLLRRRVLRSVAWVLVRVTSGAIHL